MSIKQHLKIHAFFYLITLAILVVTFSSYYRFIILNDYIVSYEGECDPKMELCFIGCENDECTKEYYYTMVQKYAPDVYAQCGEDITDCVEASVCLPSDRECSITYCDPKVDGENACEDISLEDFNINDTGI